jgi:two-component sensor histidine kinase
LGDALQCQIDAALCLDVAQAMPCGLIVNELFSNILKHAFPPGVQEIPTVKITLRQAGAKFGAQYERLMRRDFGFRRKRFCRREGLQRMVRH